MDENFCRIVAEQLATKDRAEAREYLQKVMLSIRPETHGRLMTMKDSLAEACKDLTLPQRNVLLPPHFGEIAKEFLLTPGLHIVAGMTGHGKTIWAMEWVRACAANGDNALIYSLEMTPKDLGYREMTRFTTHTLMDFYSGSLGETEIMALESAIQDPPVDGAERIYIQHLETYDWDIVRSELENDLTMLNPRVLVLDYVQMLRADNYDRMSVAFERIARDLKAVGERRGIAVLLCSQFNREALKRSKTTSAAKMLQDYGYLNIGHENIKESGGIAEASDSVQIVVDLSLIEGVPMEFENLVQITIDKNRKLGRRKNYMVTKEQFRGGRPALSVVTRPF